MTTLYNFQKTGVEMLTQFHGRALLADSMGLGKTIQALAYLHQEKLRPVIVVCPAGLKYHWQAQAAMHFGIRAEVLSGMKVPRGYRIPTACNFIIVSYNILGPWLPFLLKLRPSLVILDEAQQIKSQTAQRSHNTKTLVQGMIPTKAGCIIPTKKLKLIAISGTPLVSRPAELWNVLNMLWPKEFPSFHPYAHRYCQPRRAPWGWTFKGATRLPELHSRLKSLGMIRRLKENVLKELPPMTTTVLPVDIKNRREYDEAETAFVHWLQKNFGRQKADRAARSERLVQFGYLKRLAAKLKIDSMFEWIDEFIEGSSEKLIVFGIHKNIIGELYDRYKKLSVKVDGSVTGHKRHLAIQQFQKSKQTRILIGNIQAAGAGWDGSCASHVGIFELPWTPGECTQAAARPHRIGQKGNVNVTYLVARGTIEESLCKLLQEKQSVLNQTLDGSGAGESLDILDKLTQSLLRRK